MKISIIGTGNLGSALAQGLIAKRICAPAELTCTVKRKESLEKLATQFQGVRITTDNAAACAGADCIVLAVKPRFLESVAAEIKNSISGKTIILSLVAGVSFETLSALFGNKNALFSVIPNTAIAYAQSMTFIVAHNAGTSQENAVRALFEGLGQVCVLEELQMAAGTALASCGIAFAMRYIEAAIAGGVRLGFDEKRAGEIVRQTVRGALAVLENSNEVAGEAIRRVATPGGITERGLQAMDEANFVPAVIAGLEACR